ncbi:extracellular solute-binding protein [Paenibacillus nasutitermitis]|uniref:Sugar ABC transporter substrate-binding protein n=1 Tax=Paenibacillus nasutitermitis TaxID=1652958 RepID=A0A917DUP2_9BACL|nr:extracellular solute-binding protein [Paenibacillus nasutitermitis]GGD72147.1 sugar ABC transporter substrate-binding protein [Paenibacillus nasutitermitis]
MKRNVKRVVLMPLAFGLLAMSIAACSNSTGNDTSDKPVTITLQSHYNGTNETFLKPIIDKWNKENPLIQVKLDPVDFENLVPTIMAKSTAGKGADILHFYTLWSGQLQKNKMLAEAPESVKADVEAQYPDGAKQGSYFDGKLLGWPTEVQTYGFFYNKRLFEEAGIAEPPKTWDEMLEVAVKLNKNDASGKPIQQGLGLARGAATDEVKPFAALLSTAGVNLYSEDMTKSMIDSDASKKLVDVYSKIYGKGGTSDIGFVAGKAMSEGKLGMMIHAGWYSGSLRAKMGDNFKDIAVTDLPSMDGTGKGSLTYTFSWGVSEKSKNKEAAWKFLTWFNTEPVYDGLTPEGKFLLDTFNQVSSRKSDQETKVIKDKLATDPILAKFNEIMFYAHPEQAPVAATELFDLQFKEIEKMWTGQETPDQMISAIQSVVTKKLAESN